MMHVIKFLFAVVKIFLREGVYGTVLQFHAKEVFL